MRRRLTQTFRQVSARPIFVTCCTIRAFCLNLTILRVFRWIRHCDSRLIRIVNQSHTCRCFENNVTEFVGHSDAKKRNIDQKMQFQASQGCRLLGPWSKFVEGLKSEACKSRTIRNQVSQCHFRRTMMKYADSVRGKLQSTHLSLLALVACYISFCVNPAKLESWVHLAKINSLLSTVTYRKRLPFALIQPCLHLAEKIFLFRAAPLITAPLRTAPLKLLTCRHITHLQWWHIAVQWNE